MAKITFDSLNHSHTAGMFTVTGKDYLSVANKLKQIKGVDSIEHDQDNQEFVFTYCKAVYSQDAIKELFKQLKKG